MRKPKSNLDPEKPESSENSFRTPQVIALETKLAKAVSRVHSAEGLVRDRVSEAGAIISELHDLFTIKGDWTRYLKVTLAPKLNISVATFYRYEVAFRDARISGGQEMVDAATEAGFSLQNKIDREALQTAMKEREGQPVSTVIEAAREEKEKQVVTKRAETKRARAEGKDLKEQLAELQEKVKSFKQSRPDSHSQIEIKRAFGQRRSDKGGFMVHLSNIEGSRVASASGKVTITVKAAALTNLKETVTVESLQMNAAGVERFLSDCFGPPKHDFENQPHRTQEATGASMGA